MIGRQENISTVPGVMAAVASSGHGQARPFNSTTEQQKSGCCVCGSPWTIALAEALPAGSACVQRCRFAVGSKAARRTCSQEFRVTSVSAGLTLLARLILLCFWVAMVPGGTDRPNATVSAWLFPASMLLR